MSSPDLEARVTQLEVEVQELRHSSAVAGLSLGLTLVQNEVHELRQETREGFTAVGARLTRIEAALQELLSR